MTFIKIQNVVINTSYVAAFRLDNQTIADEKSGSVLLATLQFLLFQWDTIVQNLYHSKWIEFTGEAAITLQDYFTSFNNVIDRANFRFWILDFFGSSYTHCGGTNLNANLKLQI